MQIRLIPSAYNPEQIIRYLQHVQFPKIPTTDDLQGFKFPANLENLTLLKRLHFLAFPFETTAMFYTKSREVDISPQGAYNRFLAGKGFGSYCYGQNTVFLNIILGLGYRAYAVGARVNQAPPPGTTPAYGSVQHMALLTQLDEGIYVVDVGFGGDGLVRPIPFVAGAQVEGSAPPEEHRLVRNLPLESSLVRDDSTDGWVVEVRNGARLPDWRPLYWFTEAETFEADRKIQSYAVNYNVVETILSSNVICVSFFSVDGEGGKRHLGRNILFGKELARRLGDSTERIATFTTEQERIEALVNIMRLGLSLDDMEHMKGTKGALTATVG